jgi:hypothetical protein
LPLNHVLVYEPFHEDVFADNDLILGIAHFWWKYLVDQRQVLFSIDAVDLRLYFSLEYVAHGRKFILYGSLIVYNLGT